MNLPSRLLLPSLLCASAAADTALPVASPEAPALLAVDGDEHAGVALAVGDRGTIVALTRSRRWPLRSPTKRRLRAVSVEGETIIAAGDAGTVVRSFDGGASFSLVPVAAAEKLIAALTAEGVLFVASTDAIYRSGDGGAHWSSVWRAGDYRIERLLRREGELVAVGYQLVDRPGSARIWHEQLLHSVDGGASWQPRDFLRLDVTWQPPEAPSYHVQALPHGETEVVGHARCDVLPLTSGERQLRALWVRDRHEAFAVGDGGAVLHGEDGRWQPLP